MFLFSPCQVGAETALKAEVARLYPALRPAFSRSGFLTFKVPEKSLDMDAIDYVAEFANRSVFARSASISLGMVQSSCSAEVAREAWKLADANRFFVNRIHVFRRDLDLPGENGFEPGGRTPELLEIHRLLFETAGRPKFFGFGTTDPTHPALAGETVLDLIQVESDRYFVGVHLVAENASIQSYYPGGVMPLSLPKEAVSRAWLKFEEGICWAGLPIGKSARCLDIGSAPGGGSQVLLARGAEVVGVDPAEMDPIVLKNPRFIHVRGKLHQTKRSLYKHAHWLIADMNVAPSYTLDVLGDLVARKDTKFWGMVFTLKLFQWAMADKIPEYAKIIRQWGFDDVRIKQLAFNRREVMVAALKTQERREF